MSDGLLHVDEAAVAQIVADLSRLSAGINEMAGSNYVQDNVFSESTGQSAGVMAAMLPALARCSTSMTAIVVNMATYLEQVIDEFDQADLALAVEARHVNSPKTGG
ncbi:MAG: hypothetical protein LBV06_08660 [Propionibacteriaceae bacterium]|jgi:hypothetical protein|nr:hypothetical protein [Propionibacteriaceae bacterium]